MVKFQIENVSAPTMKPISALPELARDQKAMVLVNSYVPWSVVQAWGRYAGADVG